MIQRAPESHCRLQSKPAPTHSTNTTPPSPNWHGCPNGARSSSCPCKSPSNSILTPIFELWVGKPSAGQLFCPRGKIKSELGGRGITIDCVFSDLDTLRRNTNYYS